MQTARRLYLYAMSGVTLAVVSGGLAILLEVVISGTGILDRPSYDYRPSSREQLSQAIAMLGVGIPVWAIHWWIVQRGAGRGGPEGDVERGSALRGIYLTIALAVSLLVWVTGGVDALRAVLLQASGARPDQLYLDPVGAASRTVVALLVWLYHGSIRRADLRRGEVGGVAAWAPRLYLYGVCLPALWAAISAIGSIALFLVTTDPGFGGDDYARIQAISGAVVLPTVGLVWLGHWRYASRIARSDDWRGAAERISKTRLAAFVATIVVAAGFAISGIASVVEAVVSPLALYVPGQDDSIVGRLIPSLAVAVPWALAWWLHVQWLRREPASADPARALHQARLETHGVSGVALAIGATSLGWLLGLVIDVAFGGDRTRALIDGPPFWMHEVAFWLPLAAAGLGVWVWQWSFVLARRRRDPEGEANSTIRRTFLYLTVAVALVAALGSAAVILYRVVGTVLGAGLSGNAISELSTPIGASIAAVVVLAYHGLLLRSDQKLRPASVEVAPAVAGAVEPAAPPDAGPAPTVAEAGPPRVRRTVEIVGPEGADLDATIELVRGALPDGFDLRAPGP